MKRILFSVLVLSACYLPSSAQSQKLPGEINEYYKIKNFLSTYSTQQERSMIQSLYMCNKDLSALKDPRLNRIARMLYKTWAGYYPPVILASGHKTMMPAELLLPTRNRVLSWKRMDGKLIVVVDTSVPAQDMIHKAIRSYSSSMTPDYSAQSMPYEDSSYHYRETHQWNYIDGRWVKSPVMMNLIQY